MDGTARSHASLDAARFRSAEAPDAPIRGGTRRSLLAGLALLPACATPTHWLEPPSLPAGTPRPYALHLTAPGWHTELAFDLHAIADTPLARFVAPRFPAARHILCGFGQRHYFTLVDPDLGDLIAALRRGPSAIRITAARAAPPEIFPPENIVTLPVTAAGLGQAARFVWEDLEKDAQGAPRPIAESPNGRGVFYAAVTPYDLEYTCNTWTVLGLRLAGVPIDTTGVVFARQALGRAREAARATMG